MIFLAIALEAPRLEGIDLSPTPDAIEYGLLANRLASFQAPLIQVGWLEYPSRYALAYPLALVPAVWLTGFHFDSLHWASMVFCFMAIVMLFRVGRWIVGSSLGGCLAAIFWALHPQTIWSSTVVMSEPAVILVFLVMLDAARPILTRNSKSLSVSRGLGLGLAAGWLTVAKPPFVFWALLLGIWIAYDAWKARRWLPLAAYALAGAAWAVGELAYRRWAFGDWFASGYAFWVPSMYKQASITFNLRYLHSPYNPILSPTGNLTYYGDLLRGKLPDFQSPLSAWVLAAGAVLLAWPAVRGRIAPRLGIALCGWAAIGTAFCLTYFFQSARFVHIWSPLLDMLAAWTVVKLARMVFSFRSRARRLSRWAAAAALVAGVVLANGEARGLKEYSAEWYGKPDHPFVPRVRGILADVPKGAWILTNYQATLVDLLRPSPGPTAALYSSGGDQYLNCHACNVITENLPPRRWTATGLAMREDLPPAWRERTGSLFDAEERWALSAEDEEVLFRRPVYVLVVRPQWPLETLTVVRRVIQPALERHWRLIPIQTYRYLTLYRAEPGASDAR